MVVALTPTELAGTAGKIIAGTGTPLVAGDTTTTTVANDGRMYIIATTDASARTITFTPSQNIDAAAALTGVAINLLASRTYVLGPFPPKFWGTTLTFAVSNIAVTVAALHVP